MFSYDKLSHFCCCWHWLALIFARQKHNVPQHVGDLHWIHLKLQLSVLYSHTHWRQVAVSFTFQSTFPYFKPHHVRCSVTFISFGVSFCAGRGGRFLSCFKYSTCSTDTQPGFSAPFRIKPLVYQVWKYSLESKNSLHKIFHLPVGRAAWLSLSRVDSPMVVWWQDQVVSSQKGDIILSHVVTMGSLHGTLVEHSF